MSILGNLLSRIRGRGQPVTASAPQPPPQRPAASTSQPATGAPTAAAAMPRMDDIDLARLLDDLAGQGKQKLDWRRSIVDLMKLLGMSSSLAERRELAQELGYSGDTKDTAQMNIWLHQQVLRRIADNGGKVPQDLLH